MMIKLDSSAAPDARMGAMLVSTQYMENYSFDEDGNPDPEGYWKAKGGTDYIVRNVDSEASKLEVQLLMDRVSEQVEWSNVASRSFIIGIKIVPVDYDAGAGQSDPSYAAYLRQALQELTV